MSFTSIKKKKTLIMLKFLSKLPGGLPLNTTPIHIVIKYCTDHAKLCRSWVKSLDYLKILILPGTDSLPQTRWSDFMVHRQQAVCSEAALSNTVAPQHLKHR